MPFASALSQHPVTAEAVGEVAGQVLDRLGPAPDLALLFVTSPHADSLGQAGVALARILGPGVVLGCAAESVAGTGREVERRPAVSLWAGRWEGRTEPVLAVRLEAAGPAGPILGWPDDLPFEPRTLLLLADPFSFPADAFFGGISGWSPSLSVVGGMASAAAGAPGGNRLLLDDQVVASGAVGVLLGPGLPVATVVSQGCRPIGHPLVVTRADGNIVHELAGQPPMQRLLALARSGLSQREVALINEGGLHLGRVVDERKPEFGPGDFLIRNVLGADQEAGALAVNDHMETGTTVQFHLRDAEAAHHDLRELLAGRRADAALLVTCNGRGTRLFGRPDHDAAAVAEALGPVPTGGFAAAGEFGPVGGHNFVHGFTASVALFTG
ncbi:MAG: FIST signal transduction protein [Acidimicrobiales bacterium]